MVSAHRPTTSVVIPARNEASNLQYVLPHIPSIVSEVILVGGHSTDDTQVLFQKALSETAECGISHKQGGNLYVSTAPNHQCGYSSTE